MPEATLEVVEPGGVRRNVTISKSPFIIGRPQAESPSDLALRHPRISRAPKCAEIVYVDGGFRLMDRGQKHGLYVNGQKVEARQLEDGDTISFGGHTDSYTLVFRQGPAKESVNEILDRLVHTQEMDDPRARGLRQLSLLLETTALLQSQLPLEEVLSRVVDHAIEITGADRGALLQNEGKAEPVLVLARQKGRRALPVEKMRLSHNALRRALRFQHSVVVENIEKVDLAEAKSVVEQGLRSLVAIPLLPVTQVRALDTTYAPNPQDVLGVLYLDSRQPAVFSQMDRQVLDALAADAASVLDKARLVKNELELRRMQQELSIAREIQQALLPKEFKKYPHLEMTGTNRSCLAVGGDYFDVMELGDERTAFVIADVCGKGLGAALVTAMLQGTFSAMTLGQEPTQVFRHINGFICQHSEMERYATLFYGIADRQGRLTYVNAGHLPPLLIRDGKVEQAMEAKCLPIGLIPEADFSAQVQQLKPGETVVLYTDGITEAENPSGEQFGLDRLQEIVARHSKASIHNLQKAILSEVEDFVRGAYQSDDVTLLIVRCKG